MKIKIKDETQISVLSNKELNNYNFVDLELYDEQAKDKNNPRGFVSGCTIPVDDLKVAVDAFVRIKEIKIKKEKGRLDQV